MNDNCLIPRFVIGFSQVPEPLAKVWQYLYEFLAVQKALPKIVELRSRVGPAEKRG